MKTAYNAEVGTLNAEVKLAKRLSHAAAFAVLMLFGAFAAIAGPVTVMNVTASQQPASRL
ncbi:MAG: hypothetical protein ACOYOU_21275 [Kiritimatiellia bacterium]